MSFGLGFEFVSNVPVGIEIAKTLTIHEETRGKLEAGSSGSSFCIYSSVEDPIHMADTFNNRASYKID